MVSGTVSKYPIPIYGELLYFVYSKVPIFVKFIFRVSIRNITCTGNAIMIITFTDHAHQRMKERGITTRQVLKALQNPEITMPSRKGTAKIYNTVDGRKICVIVSRKIDYCKEIKVISVWWR